MTYTRAQKRAEIGRELALRRRLYPYWVANGQLTKRLADARIKIMEAIAQDYSVVDKDQYQLPLTKWKRKR